MEIEEYQGMLGVKTLALRDEHPARISERWMIHKIAVVQLVSKFAC